MAEVGKENAIAICRDYLSNLGLTNEQLDEILYPVLFEEGLVQLLTDAGVINANKSPNTTAKTTHIHITGPSRLLFYTEEELKIPGGKDDEQIQVELLNVNLAHLLFLGAEREETLFNFSDPVNRIATHTVKKISSRGGQVQLSKTKLDGPSFITFRSGIYADDLLVFLKYANRESAYLILAIPALQAHELVNTNSSRQLSSTTAQTIGAYSINQDRDREVSSNVNLSDATDKRLDRSMRHQELLRNIAVRLQNAGYTLYEGMIDCLATKQGSDVLILEMKTLDGTPSDEMHQVRDALGQLLYYDFLQSGQFENEPKLKFACFESEISEKHQQLLLANDCYVIWLGDAGEVCGEEETLSTLQRFGVV